MGKLGLLILMLAGCRVAPLVPPPSPSAPNLPHQTFSVVRHHPSTQAGVWTSSWQVAVAPFDALLPSWNVSGESAFRVEVQVGDAGQELNPWLDLGGWGDWPAHDLAASTFARGKVAIDIVQLTEPARRARVRVRSAGPVKIDSLHFCFTDTSRLASHDFEAGTQRVAPLPVPQRRQTDESPELAPRICSPTSVSMLLDYRGSQHSTARVARELYDGEHDIYGNWNRAVQGAWRFDVPGYLTRINDWNEVAQHLQAGNPLIISIGVKAGQLSGAPYESTAGHLLVLCGLDGEGNALVRDPAIPSGESGWRRYSQQELNEVWLRRGGTTYLLGGYPTQRL
jgi:hypothetical protein